MRFMQFLVETAEEDRAIISLSTVLFKIASQHADQSVNLGPIGELVNTPLTAVNDISIVMVPGDEMSSLYARLFDVDEGSDTTSGIWVPEENSIYINSSLFGTNKLKATITHELRHALDDMKSGYKASEAYGYNVAPTGKDEYKGQPAEINARFAEVMHYLTGYIAKQDQQGTLNRDDVVRRLYELMGSKQISTMFPEKTQSKAYKRLLKRAMDFVTKEMAYRQSRRVTQ